MARKGKVVINRDWCKACYLCIRSCPVKVLVKDTELNSAGYYPVKPEDSELLAGGNGPEVRGQEVNGPLVRCIACGNCYEVCPDVCIEIFELSDTSLRA
ncbi:MAG: 4Fe-4S dicluster domain-containing protein [Treponema sp.]|nr:4Fe-4S dicluster domain-containing protein [Treponema sp.]